MVTRGREQCRLRQGFFGLTHNYMKGVYEIFFQLKNNYNWSFIELYNLPVALRSWFVQKYVDQIEEQKAKNNEFSTN